ncbi:MAG: ARPP-1 family domain-containing protein [Methanomicrobiales archaeon]
MNIRVVFVVFLIFAFALGTGIWSYQSLQGLNLNQAYDAGNIEIVQNTTAGTVPHQVTIKNNRADSVKIKVGDTLKSPQTQDLVIAEDKIINPNTTSNIQAYCIEPAQRAVVGDKLIPSNNSSSRIIQIIKESNIQNPEEALKAQIRIWVLVSGDNLNIYRAEPYAVVQTQGLTFTEMRNNVSEAKIEVMTKFNMTSEQLNNFNLNDTDQSQSWIDGIIIWIRTNIGI